MGVIASALRRLHAAFHEQTLFVGLVALVAVFWASRPIARLSTSEARDRPDRFQVVVETEARRLLLYCNRSLLAVYPCAVGPEAVPGKYKVQQQRRDERSQPAFALEGAGKKPLELHAPQGAEGTAPCCLTLDENDLERLAPFLVPGTPLVVR